MTSCAGFLEATDAGTIAATTTVASPDTARRLASVEARKAELEAGPAADIGSSITLVWACMEALPRILTGDALDVAGVLISMHEAVGLDCRFKHGFMGVHGGSPACRLHNPKVLDPL